MVLMSSSAAGVGRRLDEAARDQRCLVDKATGLVEQLMGDNAKLLKLVAKKEDEAAGWKMMHEQSSAS